MATNVNNNVSVVKSENGKVTVNGKEYPVTGSSTNVKVSQVNGKGTLTINGTSYPLEAASGTPTTPTTPEPAATPSIPTTPNIPAIQPDLQNLLKDIQTQTGNIIKKGTTPPHNLSFADFQGIQSSVSGFVTKLREKLKGGTVTPSNN